ncbi:MAG: bifunctional 5,10-methylenetetrahydrofolate dehydrogenase/5,10-methenyltetrahydrofolate cyclohydrolase [Patescibacteria group bacterium]|nr:bifunctional 5,10-methylenetetrahydrofolate dehydrogenase/5,10-methenyltetrahydrofolate cyclohydrolase [Patescibacteria group bacterium]
MKLLDGKKIAADWQKALNKKVAGKCLAAVMVGDNPASVLYLKKKADMAKKLGVTFTLHSLPANTTTEKVVALVRKLNTSQRVNGIIVQLPLPSKMNEAKILEAIAPSKDVDGLTDASLTEDGVLPATAAGIVRLLESYWIPLTCQSVALIGFTRLLNVALAVYLSSRGNEVVVVQKGTQDMAELKRADIIITAAGRPGLVLGKHVGRGAVVVDAGITRRGKTVVGDVDFESVKKQAAYITPVPGGVGPMTVMALFANLAEL